MACTTGNLPSGAQATKPVLPKNETCYPDGIPQRCTVYRNERGVVIRKVPLKDLGKKESGRTIESPLSALDLNQWQEVGQAIWTRSKHHVTAHGVESGFLMSPDNFTDFKLTVEFRIEPNTNSGIFIRCQNPQQIDPDTCYEMNIWDNHPIQKFRTGSIVKHVPPEVQVHTLDRWNTYEIAAHGSTLDVFVNGIRTARLKDSRWTKGFVALQFAESGSVEFRNLIVETY